MFSQYWMPVTVLLATAGIVAAVFTVPALTEGGGTSYSNGSPAFRETVQNELSYCSGAGLDVDCACFAQKSGHIIMHKRIRGGTYSYAPKKDLARGQAADTCS